ncbi:MULTISPECIES: nitroreductase family protein [unclassified Streptomyces]|uniref:nitroreductase family protein n=1 Tax=unclassified Streptomyces TaxID=2593676 RepID=UPI002E1EED0E|nr:nitroreductase family protein [Streptomyces sp. NBC_01023]
MPLLDQRDVMDEFATRLAADRPVPALGSTGRAVPLPAGSLWEVLSSRHSVRSFADRPIAATDLSELLATALATERDRWPARTPDDLTVLMQVHRVRGLAAGWYEVAPEGTCTRVAGAPELPDPTAHFDDAPVVLSFGGDVRAAVRRAGVAGYSDLLVRAAALAHNSWLLAISRGFGGCLRGRAQYLSTAAFAAGGPGRRHLLSLTLGHPAPDPVPPGPRSSTDHRPATR